MTTITLTAQAQIVLRRFAQEAIEAWYHYASGEVYVYTVEVAEENLVARARYAGEVHEVEIHPDGSCAVVG